MPFGSFVGPDHLGVEVAGNGISKLFFTIIGAVAEAERDRIVQRILDVGATSAAAGVTLAESATRPRPKRTPRRRKCADSWKSWTARPPPWRSK
jgi:DNA invertase Pin-like site-specific DNA recombinase